eukprot:1166756-Prymnesium_polylepis.4
MQHRLLRDVGARVPHHASRPAPSVHPSSQLRAGDIAEDNKDAGQVRCRATISGVRGYGGHLASCQPAAIAGGLRAGWRT